MEEDEEETTIKDRNEPGAGDGGGRGERGGVIRFMWRNALEGAGGWGEEMSGRRRLMKKRRRS